MAWSIPTKKLTSAKDVLAAGKGPLATSGRNGSLALTPTKTGTAPTGVDRGFPLAGATATKGSVGGDKGFPLSGVATSAAPSATTSARAVSNDAWKTGVDDYGSTDYSVLLKNAMNAGASADDVKTILDKRTQKALNTPGYEKYAIDGAYTDAMNYIKEHQAPQYQGFDSTPYTAAQQAQDAYLKAQLKQTVAGLEAQKGSVTDSAEEAARQAYISYMQSRNTLPQALAASGYAGGMADSQRLALDTNLQNSQQAILKSRDTALNDIDTAVNNARLESSVQGAQAQADLARDAITAYQNFLNQQNAYANQDFWTKYGYDFQAAQAAIDREHQTNTSLQQQQWQAQQAQLDRDWNAQQTQQGQQWQAQQTQQEREWQAQQAQLERDWNAQQTQQGQQWQAQQAQQEREWQAQQGKNDTADANQTTAQKQAYESAWNLISAGVMPSQETLTAAGLNQADAQAYVAYIQRQLAAEAQKKQQTQRNNQGGGVGDNSILDPLRTDDQGKKDDTGGPGTSTSMAPATYTGLTQRAKTMIAQGDRNGAVMLVNANLEKMSDTQADELMRLLGLA